MRRASLLLVAAATLGLTGCGLLGQASPEGTPTAETVGTPETPAAATTTTPTRQASPSAVKSTPTPAQSPTPARAAALGKVKIANTEGQGAYIRSAPNTSASGNVWPEGTVIEVVGSDQQGEDGAWKNVRDPDGKIGWIFAELTAPAGADEAVGAPAGAAAAASTESSAEAAPTEEPAAASTPATDTGAPEATPAAAASPAAAAEATAAPAAASGDLAVSAAVANNTVQSGQQQSLTVTVTRGGAPVPNATVRARVISPGETRNIDVPATGADGSTSVSFSVGASAGSVRVVVDASTPDGASADASANFEAQ